MPDGRRMLLVLWASSTPEKSELFHATIERMPR
jgi:hypothetical protein